MISEVQEDGDCGVGGFQTVGGQFGSGLSGGFANIRKSFVDLARACSPSG